MLAKVHRLTLLYFFSVSFASRQNHISNLVLKRLIQKLTYKIMGRPPISSYGFQCLMFALSLQLMAALCSMPDAIFNRILQCK